MCLKPNDDLCDCWFGVLCNQVICMNLLIMCSASLQTPSLNPGELSLFEKRADDTVRLITHDAARWKSTQTKEERNPGIWLNAPLLALLCNPEIRLFRDVVPEIGIVSILRHPSRAIHSYLNHLDVRVHCHAESGRPSAQKVAAMDLESVPKAPRPQTLLEGSTAFAGRRGAAAMSFSGSLGARTLNEAQKCPP